MQKLSKKWDPKCLKADQKRLVSVAIRLRNFWNFFVWRDPNDFLLRLVTVGETWLCHSDKATINGMAV
jgi:hypothetical protein